MSAKLIHGKILGGLVTTPDLVAALADYRDVLGFELVEQGPLSAELAASWGCPASAGAASAMLRPASGAVCFYRLVEQAIPPGFVPTTTFGWASYEVTAQDVFGWPERLAGSGFDVIGPPREIPELPYFVAMQVHGRGKEMLYFNEVRMDTPTTDLPRAASPMDHIFMVILAARDREASVAWYRDYLGLDAGDTYVIEYTMINKAFGLPAETKSSLSMVQAGRLPIFEIDDYPPQAAVRPCLPDCLPPGNALLTLAVDSLDLPGVDWITRPVRREGPLYGGCRSATTRGPSGELLELVEIG